MAKTVLFLVDGMGLSGKTRTLAYLATHLDRSRFRSVVCTFDPERNALTEQLEAEAVPIHVMPCGDGLNFQIVPRLTRLIRGEHAAIVHCYNPRPILYGGLAAKWAGVGGTIGFLSAFACQVPDRVYDFLPQPLATKSRRNIYRNRASAYLMQHLVTVSPSLGRRFCEYNGLPVDKLRVVPYGADLGAVGEVRESEVAALRQELGFTPSDLIIGSIGRLVEQKDYPTQLKAFALAAARVPELKMVLAGGGPLDASLRALVEEYGVADRVRFLGHWTRVPCLLRSLDIFVLASKFEPFGVALLEAKAAGLAIAATRVNEIPEIIADNESGMLCSPGSPESLADVLVTLSRNQALRQRLGRRALTEARERHSLDAVVNAYQNLYESSLN